MSNPPFNDSDTALRASAFLQTGGTLQVMAERQDNIRIAGPACDSGPAHADTFPLSR
jgi:hypothetical protein